MPDPTPTPKPDDRSSSEFRDFLREMFSGSTSSSKPSDREERLLRENFKQREKTREANERATAAEAKVPKEGSVILTADQAKEWQALAELKLPVADIKTRLTERDQLSVKDKERTDAEQLAEAGTAIGVTNTKALVKLLKTEGLALEFKDTKVKQDDNSYKTERVPFVRKADVKDAAPEPLADYIERELSEFIPALTAEPDAGEESEELPAAERSQDTSTAAPTRRLGEQRTPASTRTPFPARSQRTPSSRREQGPSKEDLDRARNSGMYGSLS